MIKTLNLIKKNLVLEIKLFINDINIIIINKKS